MVCVHDVMRIYGFGLRREGCRGDLNFKKVWGGGGGRRGEEGGE